MGGGLFKWLHGALIHRDRHRFSRANQNGCALIISPLRSDTRTSMSSLNTSVVRGCARHNNTRGTWGGANALSFPPPSLPPPHQYVNLCSVLLQQMTHRDYVISATSWVLERRKDKEEKGESEFAFCASGRTVVVCRQLWHLTTLLPPKNTTF